MTDSNQLVDKLLRQQSAIAAFGTFALRESDLQTILAEAARVCAEGLDVPFSKICRYCADKDELVIIAGYGWNAGVIGYVVPHPDDTTPQGRAFSTGQPSISNALRNEEAFVLPPFYAEHGIIATIDVIIKGEENSYGVLEIDSNREQDYDQQDIDFLTSFANVLAEAVATSERIKTLNANIEDMKRLVHDKDKLLDQKRAMSDELQHRVRNNLQIVGGMLNQQLADTEDARGQRGLKAINRRVFTLSQVYDQLWGTEMTPFIDSGAYIRALCINLAEVQTRAGSAVKLQCETEPIMLDLDKVTALGIIVAELVANSFEHAFPTRGGLISVSMIHDAATQRAVLIVSDDGIGFTLSPGSKRHGVGLVQRLTCQLDGVAHYAPGNGACWTIHIPAKLA